MNRFNRIKPAVCVLLGVGGLMGCSPNAATVNSGEPRTEVSYLRGPYNAAMFRRNRPSEQYSAGFHYHHGKQHDLLQLTPLKNREQVDADFDRQVVEYVTNRRVKVGPTMAIYGPYTGQMAWKLYRTIDWTHQHHEQTYDIMASRRVPWDKKKVFTNRAVRY